MITLKVHVNLGFACQSLAFGYFSCLEGEAITGGVPWLKRFHYAQRHDSVTYLQMVLYSNI